MIAEYIKCSVNPVYFTKKYVKIINVDRGLISADLYPYQEKVVEAAHHHRYLILCFCRQSGKTTAISAYVLWYIIFHSDKTVAILANKAETAQEILSRIKTSYEHLPHWLQHGAAKWNETSFVLENRSRILSSATSKSSIRGFSINVLVLDEVAHIENWSKFSTSTLPTIASGKTTQIIQISTPNGLNHFYKTLTLARQGKNDYYPIEVTWKDVPNYRDDPTWKERTLAQMNYDYEQFAQEYENEFLGSSGTLVAGWKLKELVSQTPINIVDGLIQYKKPEKNHQYVLVADTSRGKGLDYSAFSVIDITAMPYQQVAAYRNNQVTPIDYAEIVYQISKLYNESYDLIEINDIGQQVADYVFMEYGYDNVISTATHQQVGKRVSGGFTKSADRGIRTTKKVKSVGCSILKLLIEQNSLIINDEHTISELKTFSRKNQSYEAEPGCHDDLVMGLVLFAWLTDQGYFKEINNIDTLNNLRDQTNDEIFDNILPFGFADHLESEGVGQNDMSLLV